MNNSRIEDSSIGVSSETISEIEEKMTSTSAIGNYLDFPAECSDHICSESNLNEHFVMGEDTEVNLDANCVIQLGVGEEFEEDISASGVGSDVVMKNEVPFDNFCFKYSSGEQPTLGKESVIEDNVNGLLPPDIVPEVSQSEICTGECLGQLICDGDVLVISGPSHFQNDLLKSTEDNLDNRQCQPTSEDSCTSPLLKSPSYHSTVNVDGGDSKKRGLDACEMFAVPKRFKTAGTSKASEFTDDVDFYEKMMERNVIPMGYRESVENQVTDHFVDKMAESAVDKETELTISDVDCTTSLSKDTENFKKDVIECSNSYMSEEDMIEVEEVERERSITEKDLDECRQSDDASQHNNCKITSHETLVETLDIIEPLESAMNVRECVTIRAQGDGLSDGLDSAVNNKENSIESETFEQPQILTDTENPEGATQRIDSYVNNDDLIEVEDVAKEGIATSKEMEACCQLLISNDVGQCKDNVETISHDESILRTFDSSEHPGCDLDTGECISTETQEDSASKSLDETTVTNSAANVESDSKKDVCGTSASLERFKTTDTSKSSEVDWDFIMEMREKNVIPLGYRESVEITDCVVEPCNANKDESVENEKLEQPQILTDAADNCKSVIQGDDSYMNDEDLIELDDAANEGSGTDKDMEEFYQSLKIESEGGLQEVVASEIGNDVEDVTEMTEIEIDEENAEAEGVFTGLQRAEKAPCTKKDKSKSAEQNLADEVSKTDVPAATENPGESPDDLLDMDVVEVDSGSDDEGASISEERIEVLCSKKVDLLITSVRGKKGKPKRHWPDVESKQGPDNYGTGYESWPHSRHSNPSDWLGCNEAYAESRGATSQKLGPPPMRNRRDFGPPGPDYGGPGPGFNPVGEGSGVPYDMPPQNYPPMPPPQGYHGEQPPQGYHGEQPPYGDASHQHPGFNPWGQQQQQQSQWQCPMPPYGGQMNQQYQDWCSWWQSYTSWYQNYMTGWNQQQQQPPPPRPDPAHYSSQGSWASTQQQRYAAPPASATAPSASAAASASARSKKNESRNSAADSKVTYKPTVAKGPVLHTTASPPSGPRLRFSFEGGAISSSSLQKTSAAAAASKSAESSATKNLVAGTSSQSDQEAENNLWVGNLPSGILAVDVRALMSRYGKVLKCRVGSMKSQKDAGLFALVTMETARDVTFCIKMLHNSYYRGQKLLVKKLKQQ